MANGEHDWWATIWQYAQGAIAAIASAASTAIGWMAFRYRKYVAMLHEHEERIQRQRRFLRRVKKVLDDNENGKKNARAIEKCRELQQAMQAEMEALNIEVGKYSEITMQCKGMMESHLAMLQGITRDYQQLQARFDQLWPLLMRREGQDK